MKIVKKYIGTYHSIIKTYNLRILYTGDSFSVFV